MTLPILAEIQVTTLIFLIFIVSLVVAVVLAYYFIRVKAQEMWKRDREIEQLRFSLERRTGLDIPSTHESEGNLRAEKGAGGRTVVVQTPDIPNELVEACRTGNCILFCGTGLSAQAGYPTWREALASLIKQAED